MHQFPLQQIDTVLCIGAHSDDLEIGCGGTVLNILNSNPNVKFHWVVFSADGRREHESMHSAKGILGEHANRIQIHKFQDSYFPSQWKQIKKEFSRLRREVRPQLIFTHRLEDRHQDHRAISELTWNAFRNHPIFEYEIPKYEGDLGQPNVFVPLDERVAQWKCDWVMSAFPTQVEKYWFDESVLMSLMRLRGMESGQASQFAEGFYCRKLAVRF